MATDGFWRPYSRRAALVRRFIPDVCWTIRLTDRLTLRASIKKHIRLFRESYRRGEIATARAILSSAPPAAVVYDIGANIGLYTLLFAEDPEKRVFSFEPSTAVLPLLRENVARNRLGNVRVEPVLLSNYTGQCRFTLDEVTTATSHVSAPGEPGTTCECWDLDSYILEKALPRPDILKLDVECHDMQVLEGMRETLVRHRPIVYVEGGVRTTRGEIAAIPYLASLGFAIWNVNRTRTVSADTTDYDFLALPA